MIRLLLLLVVVGCADATGPEPCRVSVDTATYYHPVTFDTVAVQTSLCIETGTYLLP